MKQNDAAIAELSRGLITKPESYNYVTFLPEPRGLYCADVFGPVKWKAKERALDRDDRDGRWGHIELSEPVVYEGHELSKVLVVPPVHRRWARLTPEERLENRKRRRADLIAMVERDEWEYRDESLEERLASEGLADPDNLDISDEMFFEHPLNTRYRVVLNDGRMLARLVQLGAPPEIYANARAELLESVNALDAALREAPLPAQLRAACGIKQAPR
jgi:hypothetical protein